MPQGGAVPRRRPTSAACPGPREQRATSGQWKWPSPRSAPPILVRTLRVQAGGWHRDSRTGRYVQQVTLTNLSRQASPGPVSLALDHLSSTAALYHPNGDRLKSPSDNSLQYAVGENGWTCRLLRGAVNTSFLPAAVTRAPRRH